MFVAPPKSRRLSCLVVLLACWLPAGSPAAEPLPKVAISNVRRAFHDGGHNAFTDLCKFGDWYYLTFRSCPDGHGVYPTSHVLVLSSPDLKSWNEVFRFRAEKRDVRDPHFLIFRDKLFVYSGAWYCGDGPPASRDMNEHLGFAAWTEDGQNWQGPQMLEGTYGHYIWRAAAHGDRATACRTGCGRCTGVSLRSAEAAVSGSRQPGRAGSDCRIGLAGKRRRPGVADGRPVSGNLRQRDRFSD